jgi:hypothetical protein
MGSVESPLGTIVSEPYKLENFGYTSEFGEMGEFGIKKVTGMVENEATGTLLIAAVLDSSILTISGCYAIVEFNPQSRLAKIIWSAPYSDHRCIACHAHVEFENRKLVLLDRKVIAVSSQCHVFELNLDTGKVRHHHGTITQHKTMTIAKNPVTGEVSIFKPVGESDLVQMEFDAITIPTRAVRYKDCLHGRNPSSFSIDTQGNFAWIDWLTLNQLSEFYAFPRDELLDVCLFPSITVVLSKSKGVCRVRNAFDPNGDSIRYLTRVQPFSNEIQGVTMTESNANANANHACMWACFMNTNTKTKTVFIRRFSIPLST